MDTYAVNLNIDTFAKAPGTDGFDEAVPAMVKLLARTHGTVFTSRFDQSSKPGEFRVDMQVSRSNSVIGFAVLMNFVMAVIAIALFSIAWAVAMNGRKLEFGMLIWAAALLFALPAVRNSLPGSPPLGALSDYCVFLWAQFATLISLCMLVMSWLRNRA